MIIHPPSSNTNTSHNNIPFSCQSAKGDNRVSTLLFSSPFRSCLKESAPTIVYFFENLKIVIIHRYFRLSRPRAFRLITTHKQSFGPVERKIPMFPENLDAIFDQRLKRFPFDNRKLLPFREFNTKYRNFSFTICINLVLTKFG